MTVQPRSRMRPTVPALLAAAMLLTGCLAPVGSAETERTICRELRADLPTYSRRDTPETLAAGARFVEVFAAVCGG